MRFSGSSGAAPAAERQSQGNLRGYVLVNDALSATADTAGGVTPGLAGTINDNDTLTAQRQFLRPINDDDQVQATLGIPAIVRDTDQVRATAEVNSLADFGYERDFVLRAMTELPAETLIDYVVIGYEISGTSFKTVANGGRIQHASAYDLRLVNLADGTQLDHNVVDYDGVAGTLRLDFRIPSRNLATDFLFRVRYGKSGVTSTEANPAGCFRRALAAWDWSAGLDLTGRNRDLTTITNVTADNLDGVGPVGLFHDDSAATAPSATWANGLTGTSLEMWVEPDSTSTAPPATTTPANRPYPNSQRWEQITFGGTINRQIDSADQHITSPYADGSMSIVSCDRTTPSATTLEIVRAAGTFPNFQFTRRATFGEGLPHPGTDPNSENLKSHAIISLPNNRLLLWYYRLLANSGPSRSIPALSTDDGVSFTLPAIGNFTFDLNDAEAFQPRGIVQAGPGYGATGSPLNTAPQYFDRDYIYIVGNNQTQGSVNANRTRPGGLIYLCRYKFQGTGGSLTSANLLDRGRYSFFTGRNGAGVPQWTADGGLKTAGVPIFRNIVSGDNQGVSYFFQISWHERFQCWIAAYNADADGIAIAHAPTLWDSTAWQMLCYKAPITAVTADEDQSYIGTSAPALWSTATRINIGASTYVEGAGGGAGDNIILTSSSALVARTDVGGAAINSGLFRLGGSAAGATKFSVQYLATGQAWQVTSNFGGALTATAPNDSFSLVKQHLVATGGSGQLPRLFQNGVQIAIGAGTAPTGAIAATADDSATFGVNPGYTAGVSGKYGRAVLWSFRLSAGWIATSYALQTRPQAAIGMGPELTAGTANRAPVAVAMFGTQPELESVDYDVAQRAYDAEGDTRTPSVPSVAAGVTATIVSGRVRVRPDGGTTGRFIEQPFRVTDALGRRSDSIIRVSVTDPVVQPDPGTPGTLPAGYPTIPSFVGATTVTVTNGNDLQAEINSTPGAGPGKIITLAAGVDYGPTNVDNPGARIKIIAASPRFSALITARSILDSRDLTVRALADPVTLDNCVVGGRAGMRVHAQNARISLIAARCGVLWLEGLDVWNAGHTARIVANVVGQVWVRKCSFDQSDGRMFLGGGTTGAGPALLVVWECYHYGDGVTRDPGTSGTATGGVLTDYCYQLYNIGPSYFYRCVFDGGYNHMISSKLNCAAMRVDECVFANYHPEVSSWKNFEVGQEGSPTGNDRTCRLLSVRNSTFTAATGTTAYRVIMAKDITGALFDGNIIYDGPGGLIDVLPAPAGRNGPNDQGVLSGTDDFTFTNNTFAGSTPGSRGTPGACNLGAMYTGTGGGYVFRASNNIVGGVRAVNRQSGKVTTSYGPSPGFSG